jgi:hypothetical protein
MAEREIKRTKIFLLDFMFQVVGDFTVGIEVTSREKRFRSTR